MEENPYKSPAQPGYHAPASSRFVLPQINWRRMFFWGAGTAVVCVGLVFLLSLVLQMLEGIAADQTLLDIVAVIIALELLFLASTYAAILAGLGWAVSQLWRIVKR